MDWQRRKLFSPKSFKVCQHRRGTHNIPEILLKEAVVDNAGVTIPALEIGSVGGVTVYDKLPYPQPDFREKITAYLSKDGVGFVYQETEDFEHNDFHYFLALPERETRVRIARALSNHLSGDSEFSRSVHETAKDLAFKEMRGLGFRLPEEHVFRLKLESNKDTTRKNGQHSQSWRVYFVYDGKQYSLLVHLRCGYHHNRGGQTYVCRWVEK